MSNVVVTCSSCQKRFSVATKHLGRTGACPGCKSLIKIERETAATPTNGASHKEKSNAPPASEATLTEEQLRAAFDGSIRPVRATITYRLGLLIATGVVLLTPIVYLSLIAAVGFGVYYHAVNHQEMLTAVRGRGAIMMAIAFGAPLVIGPISILFMLKPFFTGPRYEQRSRSLTRKSDPLLFAFVDMVCQAVRAPRPKRIDVDCQMNASASFRNGLWSMFGNDLVLTIGMPLVAGLSLRQFGGVLAHEFGHFSQGAGMRLTYVLRSVSAWLHRSVYERDAWDEWLASTAAELDLRLGWVLWLAMLMVWLARRVLWLLMMLSMVVVGYVLRQMEYDADRYEARFAGSDSFEATTTKLARLGAAMQKSYSQLGVSHREGKLVDDLPRLVLNNERKLETTMASELADQLRNASTGLFDSHPTDRDRIASARREAAEGVFRLEGPAGRLFSDFDAQCQATTWEFYHEALGGQVKRSQLKSVPAIAVEHQSKENAYDAMLRYTQGGWRPTLRIGLRRDALIPPESPKAAIEEARAHRAEFDSLAEGQRARVEKLDDWRQKMTVARAYEALHRSKVRINKKEAPAGLKTRETALVARKEAERRVAVLTRKSEEAGETTEKRLATALRLLCHDALTARLPDGKKMKKRAETLVPAFVAIEGQLTTINALRDKAGLAAILIAALQKYGASELLVDQVVAVCREVHPKLSQLREVLQVTDYPYDHTEGKVSLGAFAIPGVPPRDEIGELLNATDVATDAISDTQCRVIAELCDLAERVEKALKMPPLPDGNF